MLLTLLRLNLSGGSASVTLSGVAGVSALGALTESGSASITLAGQASTSALGGVTASGASVIALVGVGSTSALGSITKTGAANYALSGVSSTSAIGSLSETGDGIVAASGVVGTSAIGTATASAGTNGSVTLTGVAGTSALGSLTETGAASVSLSGQSSNSSLGTASAKGAAGVSLSGVASASAIGSLTETGAATVTLSGVSATSALGNASASAGSNGTANLTGVAGTSSLGSITEAGGASIALAGVASVSGLGALINLLEFSAQGITAPWSVAALSKTANIGIDQYGAATLTSFVETATTNHHNAVQTTPLAQLLGGNAYTFSAVAQANGRRYVTANIDNGVGSGIVATFDLVNGNVTATANNGTGVVGSASISPLANGNYLCVLSGVPSASSYPNLRVSLGGNTTSAASWYPSYLGSTSAGFYAGQFQLQAGTVATPFVPTSNVAGVSANASGAVNISGVAAVSSVGVATASVMQPLTVDYKYLRVAMPRAYGLVWQRNYTKSAIAANRSVIWNRNYSAATNARNYSKVH